MGEDENELLDLILNIPKGFELSFNRLGDGQDLEIRLRYDNIAGNLMYRRVLTYQEIMIQLPQKSKAFILVMCIKEMIFKLRHELDKVNPEGTHYRRWRE